MLWWSQTNIPRALSVINGKGAVRSLASSSRDLTCWRGNFEACLSTAEKSRQKRQWNAGSEGVSIVDLFGREGSGGGAIRGGRWGGRSRFGTLGLVAIGRGGTGGCFLIWYVDTRPRLTSDFSVGWWIISCDCLFRFSQSSYLLVRPLLPAGMLIPSFWIVKSFHLWFVTCLGDWFCAFDDGGSEPKPRPTWSNCNSAIFSVIPRDGISSWDQVTFTSRRNRVGCVAFYIAWRYCKFVGCRTHSAERRRRDSHAIIGVIAPPLSETKSEPKLN
jgi:hypothetical protein